MLRLLLPALGLTLLLEAATVGICCRRSDYLWTSIAGNLLTNPVVNLLWQLAWPILPPALAVVLLTLLELGAVLAEAALYRVATGDGRKRCLQISLLANAGSFLLGSAILQFLPF